MGNRVIQSNMPFATPIDEITDLQFASGETLKLAHHDSMHLDPNEEHSDKVLFDDLSAFISVLPRLASFFVASKPSSSIQDFNFGLSSSSSELVHEEIQVDNPQTHLGANIESTPKQDTTATTTKPNPTSDTLETQQVDRYVSQTSTLDTRSSAGNFVDPFGILELRDNVSDTMKKIGAIDFRGRT